LLDSLLQEVDLILKMDRRILIFKTEFGASGSLRETFLNDLDEKYVNCIQNCSLGCPTPSILTVESTYSSVLPDPWIKVEHKSHVEEKIANNKTYKEKDMSMLSDVMNVLLDSAAAPGRDLLQIVWITDEIPETPCPNLFGALERAYSWHAGHILIICPTPPKQTPDWLSFLRAEVLADCSGLSCFLTSTVCWRGSLAFCNNNNMEQGNISLEGFELHFERDDLDLVLQKIDLVKAGGGQTKNKAKDPLHFDSTLEIVCEVDPLAVPPALLSNKHFVLQANIQDDDDSSRMFMEEGFRSPRIGYIARLRYSEDLPKAYKALTFQNWKKHIIEGVESSASDWFDVGCLGPSPDYLYFLIYNDLVPQTQPSSFVTTLRTSALLLVDCEKLSTQWLTKLTKAANYRCDQLKDDVVTRVDNLDVESASPLSLLYSHKRNLVARILEILLIEEKSELIHKRSTSDLVLIAEQNIEKFWFNVISNRTIEASLVSQDDLKAKLTAKYSDNISEKEVLRWHQYLQKKIETSEMEQISSKRGDTFSFCAPEILKLFDMQTGLSTRDDLLPVSTGASYFSEQEYSQIFKESFEHVTGPEPHLARAFSYDGFKFKGDDFNVIKSTKHHDVYYNCGDKDITQDKEFVRLRDTLGRTHETSTTFDHKPVQKLKLKTGPAAATKLRSPRKKLGKTTSAAAALRRSPRKKLGQSKVAAPLRNVSAATRRNLSAAAVPRRNVSAASSPQSTLNSESGRLSSAGDSKDTRRGDAEEVRRKMMRIAVFSALQDKKIVERHPLFKGCFRTLMQICQLSAPLNCTSHKMYTVARSNVDNVIEKIRVA